MTVGQTRWSDITSISNDLYEGAVFTLRQENLLARTVTVFNDTSSMWDRKNTEYGQANPRQVAEGDDVNATKFERTLLSTLTPVTYADQFFLTDQRIRSDTQNVVADAAMEQGAAFAQQADEAIAAHFGALTGGTIGSSGGTITWASLVKARALMHGLHIRGPYWCVLHPYQWMHLVNSAMVTGTEIKNAPQFNDAMVNNYFTSAALGGVTFVVSASVALDGDDAIGAMYNPAALAYDVRQAFRVEPQRDASRRGWEWNFNTDYATGLWVPNRGITLVGDATTPS